MYCVHVNKAAMRFRKCVDLHVVKVSFEPSEFTGQADREGEVVSSPQSAYPDGHKLQ